MNKHQIHRLALLAAAKITFVAGASGCQGQPAGRGRAVSATPMVDLPAPRTSEPVEVAVAPAPAPAPAPDCSESAQASSPLLRLPRVGRTAMCDAVLTAAENGLPVEKGVDVWACCSEPGMRDKHAFCTPWGPPAPPAMPKGWA